jgi:hypothetical protein
MNTEAVERTDDGHRVRLRYGKGLRARFLIRTLDEDVAERRATKLRELAAQLVAAGHSAEAHMILTEAAGAASDRDFDAYIKVGEQFCRDKGKKKTARAATTFGKLAEQWTDGTLTREHPDHVGTKKTADDDVSRLETICAVPVAPGLRFGDLPLGSVTLDHCETVMRNLPDSAKRPATRRHYAQVIHRVLALAVFPCRLIAASPLPRGFLPRTGKPPAYPYLYPAEDGKLLAHTAIPLGRRLLWGFLAREGCRSGEATALTVGVDVDLDRGVVRLDKNSRWRTARAKPGSATGRGTGRAS